MIKTIQRSIPLDSSQKPQKIAHRSQKAPTWLMIYEKRSEQFIKPLALAARNHGTACGTIIDGKYEILKQIGKGGMSTVYLAMDRRLNKQWAVKEIHRSVKGTGDAIAVQSLLVEANLMKRLDHPALPRIVDIIEDRQKIFIVMDYIEGESLDKILRVYGPRPQEQVLDWAKQLCDVLEYLHSRKPPIIYRDMKPANVMLKPEGNLKVIDFGIAREYKEENSTDTVVLGTAGYAPPEQHGLRQTDVRSDIYALGMTMHHLLTGKDPRDEAYTYEPVRSWNPEVSQGLERVIDKCTALDPEERYRNCRELLYALEHYEEEEDAYKKRQKRKLAAFAAAASAFVVLGAVGIAARAMELYENSRDYEWKINISSSTPYETKIETYLSAIDLLGTDARAYQKLLEAYRENGLFGERQSSQFTANYNKNKEKFPQTAEEYLDLAYEAGVTYLYLYSGGDNSFRTRVLKAYPYFKTVTDSQNAACRVYGVSEGYRILGEFYLQFVVNAAGVKEPAKQAYEDLLASLRLCIDRMEMYDYDDAAYIRLTMYREIMNLLNDHRRGLAATGVAGEKVLEIYESVVQKARALAVTQQISIEIQDFILERHEEYVENMERAYENAGKRSKDSKKEELDGADVQVSFDGGVFAGGNQFLPGGGFLV